MIDQLIQTKLMELLQGVKPPAAPVSSQDYQPQGQQMDLNSLLAQVLGQTPGKGMDDDVPAQIDGQVPAALSEGEFVIPADVVSMLGDGNTDGGYKVLSGLLDTVRQKKTGSTEQPQPLLTSLSKKT
jgi:hypothetical protein